jgi:thiol-disulfide isomerase/thioredoxin
MKRNLFNLAIALLFACFTSAQTQAPKKEGYQITLNTPSYTSGIAYLTYHFGKNLNIEDSAAVSNQGVAIFKGKKSLVPGIYAIVFPGKNFSADFLVEKEQEITISADTIDLTKMQVKGSGAHTLFQAYQKFVSVKGAEMQQERIAYNNSKTEKDSLLHQDNYNRLNTELNEYRAGVIKEAPNSMMAALFNAMKDPELPFKKPMTQQDTLDNYYHYRAHYWDGVTFMDERVIRTPFFLPKFERYYREVLPQAPDSIIKDFDYKLLLARTAPEMYKFMLNWLTDEYLNPKYMGQDKILVHLYEKYHSQGLTSWLNEKQQETIRRRAYMVMSNLIGEKAANLEMIDSTGKPVSLYDLKADYTLVIFWDPTCGHCKEEIPRIDSVYRASWKAHGLKIYSVLTEDKKKEWVQYIKDHDIGEWTNVYETKEMEKAIADAQRPSYRQLYDVIQTPTLFLLDKDKRIIGKKLGWKQLNEFLETKWAGKKN